MFLAYSNEMVAAFYIAANVVCLLLFGVILYKNVTGIDRQVKSRFFDYVLEAHMGYYAVDIIWALFYFDVIHSPVGLAVCNIFIVFFASTVACVWFVYIEALQNDNIVKKLRNRLLIYLPVALVTILDIILTACGVGYKIEPNGKVVNEGFYMLLMIAPVAYVLLAFVKGMFRAFRKENGAFRKEYIMIASYPLSIMVFGITQIALMDSGVTLPILSYGTTISMVFVYVSSLDNLISLDPLTELNNRSELTKHLYTSFRNIQFEDNLFVIMLDIDKFKVINDNFGHVEGDKALQRLAKCLKNACYTKENDVFTLSKQFDADANVEFKVLAGKTYDAVEKGVYGEEVANRTFTATKGLSVEAEVANFAK